MKKSLFLFLFICSNSSFAGPFQITNRVYGTSDTAIIAQIDSLFDKVENDVNSDLPDADQKTYLRGISNSNVMSGKGSGTDYANDIEFGIFKYSWGAGVDLGDADASSVINGEINTKQLRGAAFQVGIMLGIDLGAFQGGSIGPINTQDLDLFFNFNSKDLSNVAASFTGKLSSLGFHARYKLMPGNEISPYGSLNWGGLYFTTGFEKHSMLLKLNLNINTTQTVDGLGTATLAGTATAGADVTTYSIPLELSTNVQWIYFLTTSLGAGLDLNFGEAKSLAEATTTLTTTAASGPSAEGNINMGTSDGPSSVWFRWFIGQQVNLFIFKVNLQIDHVPRKGYWGANASIAIAY